MVINKQNYYINMGISGEGPVVKFGNELPRKMTIHALIKAIKRTSQKIFENPANKELNYSEVILVLNCKNIEEYVKTIREKILKDDILSQDYYTPFIIFLFPYNLELKRL